MRDDMVEVIDRRAAGEYRRSAEREREFRGAPVLGLETEIAFYRDFVLLRSEYEEVQAYWTEFSACLETGVKALREVLRQAAADEENAGEEAGDENLFALCEEETGRLIQEQRLALEAQSDEGYEFESVAVWEYNPRFEQPVYTEETGIQAVMELTFRYSWTFRYPEYLETGDYDENGEPILEESSRRMYGPEREGQS